MSILICLFPFANVPIPIGCRLDAVIYWSTLFVFGKPRPWLRTFFIAKLCIFDMGRKHKDLGVGLIVHFATG